MLDLVEIESTVRELENQETNFVNCEKLAILYTILDYHSKDKSQERPTIVNQVVQEYSDILPSYQAYCNIKRKYELHEITEEAVQIGIQNLCKEIKEFLITLYGNTNTQLERNVINNMLKSLDF